MKIQNEGGIPPPQTGAVKTSESGRAARPAPEKQEGLAADRAAISEVAKQLDEDPARAAHVERLRVEYQSGSYRVSAKEVAAKLIDATLADKD